MHAGLQQLPEGPVYLVSTEFEGKKNIMSVAVFAYMPGRLVSIGVAPSRYSFRLVRKSGVYVVNVVDKGLVEAVRICGENSRGRKNWIEPTISRALETRTRLLSEQKREK
jgi:flavin reductase (DIM6/NTAB) family NADH-FMN oxidoreductase RutF